MVFDSQMRQFPPRLPQQPIFYPVTNPDYAKQIARDWNTREDDKAGYVTAFEVPDDYGSQFERHVVGAREHEELWVPAERLSEFNSCITSPIKVVAGYFGDGFRGYIPEKFMLKGKTATEQFTGLTDWLPDNRFDVWCEIAANAKTVFLNYLFWLRGCCPNGRPLNEAEQRAITFIRTRWSEFKGGFGLPEHS